MDHNLLHPRCSVLVALSKCGYPSTAGYMCNKSLKVKVTCTLQIHCLNIYTPTNLHFQYMAGNEWVSQNWADYSTFSQFFPHELQMHVI